jgi:excisionase family DNA binding protein
MSEIATPLFDSDTPLLTTEQLAGLLGLQRDTLYHWRLRGVGPRSIRVGGRLRYRREDVEEWLERGAKPGTAA